MRKILLLIFCFLTLKGFSQNLELTLPAGHTGDIKATIVSPDNKYVISSSADATTKIWELASGKLIYNFPDKTDEGKPYSFSQFIFKNNGTELLAVGRNVLMIFDFDKFKITKQIAVKGFVYAALATDDRTLYISNHPEQYKADILSMDLQDFSVKRLYELSAPDYFDIEFARISLNKQENKILCYTNLKGSRLIDTDGKELETFNNDVNMLCFAPDGAILGVKEDGNTKYNIRLINPDTKQVNWETNIEFKSIFSFYYNFQTIQFDKKTGLCLLQSAKDFAVFDYVNHTQPNLYIVPQGEANSACFTAKPGTYVIGTSQYAGAVSLYTFNTNNSLAGNYFGNALLYVHSLKTPASASIILLGGYNKTFKQLTITRNGFTVNSLCHDYGSDIIGISPNGKTGVNASANFVNLYSTEAPGDDYNEIKTPQNQGGPREIVFSKDGKLLATAGEREVVIIDVATKKVLKTIATGYYALSGTTGIGAFSPDNKKFVAFGIKQERAARFMACFNITTGAKLWESEGKNYTFKFTADNGVVFCIDRDSNKALWLNANTGALISEKAFGDNAIYNAIVTDDIKYALLNVGNNIEVWDLGTFTKTGELVGHNAYVSYSTLMSDEKYLISASWDNTIRIWDWKNHKELLKLVLFDENEDWVAFMPDGRFDASANVLKKM